MMYTNTGIFVENSISKRNPKSKLNRRIGKKKKKRSPKNISFAICEPFASKIKIEIDNFFHC